MLLANQSEKIETITRKFVYLIRSYSHGNLNAVTSIIVHKKLFK
jgi:hypothetical protein